GAVALTHVTIVAVTLFLHRCQAHRALELHPAASHFFRCWLWLTTGMTPRECVAVHRKQHASAETADDPDSAQMVGIGVGHWGGYRNWPTEDASTNIVPWGILIGGEELHNNHHAYPSSAKLSNRWFELDVGWLYLRLLAAAGLARVKRIPPKARFVAPR